MKSPGIHSWQARMILVGFYLMLAALLVWAATAPLTRFTGMLTAILVLGCWVPAYLYANWHDICSNRVFWVSNVLALIVTAILWLALMPRSIEIDDAIQAEARRQNSWGGIGVGVLGYIGFNLFFRFLANRVFGTLRDEIEKRLESKGP